MLNDITFGQFFPGNSFLHRLDPRIKILIITIFIVVIFFAKNIYSFAVVILFVALISLLSKIPAKTILKSIKPILFILAFTAFINIFWVKGESTPLLKFWIIEIYTEGIITAVFMAVRLTCLIVGTSLLLTFTTSPIDLTDGLERLLSPLKKLKLPVHEFAMMMTIALRFIPTLIEETQKIISAQKARGADFESGNLVKRTKAMLPILIPLFISAFRRADELAVAMECRCYRGDEGRTHMKIMKITSFDIISLLGMAAFSFFIIAANYIPTFIAL